MGETGSRQVEARKLRWETGSRNHWIRLVCGTMLPFCLGVSLRSPVAAQGHGDLSGMVEDTGGKAVPGAVVTLMAREWAAAYASPRCGRRFTT